MIGEVYGLWDDHAAPCPRCDSTDTIEREVRVGPYLAEVIVHYECRCRDCRHKWRESDGDEK